MFGAVATATDAEDLGIIPGTLFTGLEFGLFHWLVVGAVPSAILMLVIFRLIASSMILWRRNLWIGISMHMAVNIVGFWAAMIAVGA